MTAVENYVFLLIEENEIDDEAKKHYVDVYETEEIAKKQLGKEIDETMEQNQSKIIEGSVEEGYVELEDEHRNKYLFKIEKKLVKKETWE